ncbi:deferrochelatase/peroxidase EfeB [Leucobacter sp. cx-42]|uniref:iron uptake transporter deferrochelatase/peroxidase subunit n=1 Tax=unclassified Leucobacter TaxID=2621730 RepID=UPI00165DDA5B|nr:MULTISPECIES: iron uptake transporter deferrochelatase/peroxidase subunit [unclassified Leucobacter]MBC9954506.1 deferrochelatase/peroxidase EfeB [Leucobacter sp. cx-42]
MFSDDVTTPTPTDPADLSVPTAPQGRQQRNTHSEGAGDAGRAGQNSSLVRPSRRGLFGLLGAGAAGLALGGVAGNVLQRGRGSAAAPAQSAVTFAGPHQAGIVTPAQDRLHFAAFTMNTGATRDDLISLLRDWTAAASALARGEEVGEGMEPQNALLPPDDTGEASGLGPGNLTLTFGFGRSLFVGSEAGGTGATGTGADPFGIRDQLPKQFEPLPSFAFDLLDATQSGGDLCVQACSDDPQIAVHAIRNLARIATGRAHMAWSQLGFGRTASTSLEQDTPRNLFGFKDGTANVMAEEAEELADHVWVGNEAPEWMRGGSYLVARKIQMTIETWDRANLAEQERIFGRTKREGAPLTSAHEFDTPDFDAMDSASGDPKIDVAAHVRLAHPVHNGGVRLLRRGYNYVDGSNSLGQLNAGLFFISFQRDPASFVRVQQSLKGDLLNEYIRHIGSGLWAVPRGLERGGDEFIGQALFE